MQYELNLYVQYCMYNKINICVFFNCSVTIERNELKEINNYFALGHIYPKNLNLFCKQLEITALYKSSAGGSGLLISLNNRYF